MKMFDYKKSTIDTDFNDIVEGALRQVVSFANKENKTAEYKKFNEILNKNFVKYAIGSDQRFQEFYSKEGTKIFKNPEITGDATTRKNMNAVIAQVVNASLPMTISGAFEDTFMEVHHVGWGDTARFVISSNDLFMVNELGEGIERGVMQPIFNNEITVNCAPHEISTDIGFYEVASGNFDWGQFGYRAGRSVDGFILAKAIAALTSGSAGLGDAYNAAGVDNGNWTNLADKVRKANNNARVYAIGTLTSLGSAIPDNQQFQLGIGDEMAKEGYLSRYLNVPIVVMDQAMVPGTVNTTARLALENTKIFMVGAGQDSPIKVVFEGDTLTAQTDASQTTDKTYRVNIQFRLGIAAIVGAKYGTITI